MEKENRDEIDELIASAISNEYDAEIAGKDFLYLLKRIPAARRSSDGDQGEPGTET